MKSFEYFEKNNIAHRDVKLDNILFNFPELGDKSIKDVDLLIDKFEVKICDLGFARVCSDTMESRLGTPIFIAPEIYRK